MARFDLFSPLDDHKVGSTGSDHIYVWGGNDIVDGGNGSDFIFDQGLVGGYGGPFSGDDQFKGGAGNDTFYAGDGNNSFDGGSGTDTISYTFADRGVTVNLGSGSGHGEGDDSLISIENVDGSVNSDHITGSSVANKLFGDNGSDTVSGGGGNDVLLGGLGNDTLNGDSGVDTVDYSYLAGVGHVEVSLATGRATEFDAAASSQGPVPIQAGRDTLSSIENVKGSVGNDIIEGSNGNNNLSGSHGADRMTGGLGADVMSGGQGADTFVFKSLADDTGSFGQFDLITDFTHGVDKIDFSSLNASSSFDANSLLAGQQDLAFAGGGSGLGQIHSYFDSQKQVTVVEANTMLHVKGTVADFHIELAGNVALTASDFVL